jgi:glycosyltransferase involved in cell wall biosynthesis
LISNRQRTSYHYALQQMQKFDLLLSISRESKIAWQELVNSQSNIEVIYGGGSQGTAKAGKELANRKGLLCVGAEMPHKNIKRLIEAYSLLPNQTQHDHPLIVVGIRSKGTRAFLEKYAQKLNSKIILPPYLTDTELEDLYSNSRLLVMPSLVEGLSLPILEAWSHGLVAMGSACTVAEELIQDKNCLFDPTNPESMSKTITLGLTDDSFWETALVAQQRRSTGFTWAATSSRLISAINTVSYE